MQDAAHHNDQQLRVVQRQCRRHGVGDHGQVLEVPEQLGNSQCSAAGVQNDAVPLVNGLHGLLCNGLFGLCPQAAAGLEGENALILVGNVYLAVCAEHQTRLLQQRQVLAYGGGGYVKHSDEIMYFNGLPFLDDMVNITLSLI